MSRICYYSTMSYLEAVLQAQRAQPASIQYERLEGKYDPKEWVDDVYDSICERREMEGDFGFGAVSDGLTSESGPTELFHEVLGTVQEMLSSVPLDEAGPNPVRLADEITQRIQDALRRSARAGPSLHLVRHEALAAAKRRGTR